MAETPDPAVPEPDDRVLVALTPTDVAPAQSELVAWCDCKIAAVRSELSDLETNLELATEHGWKHQSVAASINRTKKRVLYYEKMKAAVAAGYLIVPNFPIDVFAVRVQRRKQREATSSYRYRRDYQTAKAELLPAGEGRYVDEELFVRDESYDRTVNGKTEHVDHYVSGDYDTVDFPARMVKPTVLEATARAMALKIFDEIGLVENQRTQSDPIVVGRLLDPRGNDRRVTFFIAWWLDTASL